MGLSVPFAYRSTSIISFQQIQPKAQEGIFKRFDPLKRVKGATLQEAILTEYGVLCTRIPRNLQSCYTTYHEEYLYWLFLGMQEGQGEEGKEYEEGCRV